MLLYFLVVKDQDRGHTKGGLGGSGLSSEHAIPQLEGEKLAFRKFFGYLVPW